MKNDVFLLLDINTEKINNFNTNEIDCYSIETMYRTEKNEKMINGFDYIFKALLRCIASSSVEHRIQDHVIF